MRKRKKRRGRELKKKKGWFWEGERNEGPIYWYPDENIVEKGPAYWYSDEKADE